MTQLEYGFKTLAHILESVVEEARTMPDHAQYSKTIASCLLSSKEGHKMEIETDDKENERGTMSV